MLFKYRKPVCSVDWPEKVSIGSVFAWYARARLCARVLYVNLIGRATTHQQASVWVIMGLSMLTIAD